MFDLIQIQRIQNHWPTVISVDGVCIRVRIAVIIRRPAIDFELARRRGGVGRNPGPDFAIFHAGILGER